MFTRKNIIQIVIILILIVSMCTGLFHLLKLRKSKNNLPIRFNYSIKNDTAIDANDTNARYQWVTEIVSNNKLILRESKQIGLNEHTSLDLSSYNKLIIPNDNWETQLPQEMSMHLDFDFQGHISNKVLKINHSFHDVMFVDKKGNITNLDRIYTSKDHKFELDKQYISYGCDFLLDFKEMNDYYKKNDMSKMDKIVIKSVTSFSYMDKGENNEDESNPINHVSEIEIKFER